MPGEEARALYRSLLERWNDTDAEGYGGLFTADGSLVGFDGSPIEGAGAIIEHLSSIFEDHQPGAYVGKVREIRGLPGGAVLLRAVAGMVPPGESDLNPELNTVQSVVAVQTGDGWRVAHFQSTPARFDGRPDEVESLTAELRAELPPG